MEGPAYHLTNRLQSPTSLAQSIQWLHSKFLERRKSGSLIQWSPKSCSTAQASASDPTPAAHRNTTAPRRAQSISWLAKRKPCRFFFSRPRPSRSCRSSLSCLRRTGRGRLEISAGGTASGAEGRPAAVVDAYLSDAFQMRCHALTTERRLRLLVG